MTEHKTLHVQIDHIDPLGQGVDKQDGKITFIAKTLPGEKATAQCYKSKKGVQFAKLITIEQASEKRITPECPHFDVCPGCDYLHTDYETELSFKRAALKKYFQKIIFDWEELEVIPAIKRTGYRNRIQLHYRQNKLGLIDGLTNRIVEIPECVIVGDALRPALKTLYENRRWEKKHSSSGHCELYQHHGHLQVAWNQAYAHGGFSQVNDEMNTQLRAAVSDTLKRTTVSSLLDLFSGNGNLSDDLVSTGKASRVMVDTLQKSPGPNFIPIDLFADSALKAFEAQSPRDHFDVMLVDPPRKGFLALNDWVARYRPNTLIYVSCHPGTLARDLNQLQKPFTITRLILIDLFPGTHHFETLAALHFPK